MSSDGPSRQHMRFEGVKERLEPDASCAVGASAMVAGAGCVRGAIVPEAE